MNSWERSTFDSSSAPPMSRPAPNWSGAVSSALPELGPTRKLLVPMSTRPSSLANWARAICPIVRVRPFVKAPEIVPSSRDREAAERAHGRAVLERRGERARRRRERRERGRIADELHVHRQGAHRAVAANDGERLIARADERAVAVELHRAQTDEAPDVVIVRGFGDERPGRAGARVRLLQHEGQVDGQRRAERVVHDEARADRLAVRLAETFHDHRLVDGRRRCCWPRSSPSRDADPGPCPHCR